jgi:TetR/AcrR family transcriptional regulator
MNQQNQQKQASEATEKKILDAARTVFHRAGYDGARMQEIADEAGINKALLHYYFRNKDKLFEGVFREALRRNLMPLLLMMTSPETTVEEKITTFVRSYIGTIRSNPELPGFIIHEINRNPDRLVQMAHGEGFAIPATLLNQIREGIEEGRYNPVDPRQLLVNLISMCIFPFIGRPMIRMALQIGDQEWDAFLEERITLIPQHIFKILHKS